MVDMQMQSSCVLSRFLANNLVAIFTQLPTAVVIPENYFEFAESPLLEQASVAVIFSGC